MTRNKKLSAPATQDEIDKFVEACATVEMQPADTLRKLAHAFVVHVHKHGCIAQPIRLEGFQHGTIVGTGKFSYGKQERLPDFR